MGSIRWTATLVPHGPAGAIVLDAEQVAIVGEGAKRFPVVATVNGYTWRTSVVRMGGEFLLGLSRAVREAANVELGDVVDVELALDAAPREVEVPEALATALAGDPDGSPRRSGCSATARRAAERGREVAVVGLGPQVAGAGLGRSLSLTNGLDFERTLSR